MPTQYASKGGVLLAASTLEVCCTEVACHHVQEIWAISIDFTKLLNTISAELAVQCARLMGLSDSCCADLLFPFQASTGFWRLPNNAIAPPVRRTGGVPQGLASSVALSEILLSVLLRRLHRCVDADSVCYIDDLNLMTRSKADLAKVMTIIWQFVQDVGLCLSLEKTKTWGTRTRELNEVAQSWGAAATDIGSAGYGMAN